MKIYQNIMELIGNTPLVDASSLIHKKDVKLLLKLESQNPGGSVKDRPAFNMINEALKRGDIKTGSNLIEATSGNTGVALSLTAKLLGLNMTLVMPESATEERIKTMKAYGAEVILTDANKGIEYSRDVALDLHQKKGYYVLNQFENDDNWKTHYNTTGPEIWKDSNGEITHFVSAMGTTGTITGVATYLKEKNKHIQIIGAQPKDGAKIPGIRKWSPDYIPSFFKPENVDLILEVSQDEATLMTKQLAFKQAVFAGMSSGGAVHAAIQVAKKIKQGTIVAIICDKGDRYLSSNLFS